MKRSLLGLDAGPEEEPADEAPSGHSLLGLGTAAPVANAASPDRAAAGPAAPDLIEQPELFQIDRKEPGAFPIERAILFSLAAHLIVVLLLVSSPHWLPAPALAHARKGLLGAFIPEEQEKIPVIFRAAPGPARENPKRSDPSNLTRRAGGGDPSRPKADTPFVPPKPGIEGLAEGPAGASRPRSPAVRSAENAPSSGAPQPKPPGASGEKQAGGPDAFRVPAPGSGQAGREQTRLAGLDRAIQQAAKDEVLRRGSGGENGAGFPNPDGGFVDTGGLSFDTSWYDWGDYADAMVRRIKLHWHPPMDLMYLGAKGKVSIRFFIMADGAVTGVQLLRPSDHPPYTSAAMQAILTSNPFRPLPKDLLRMIPGKDREGIVVTFFYNMRPGKEGEETAR